MPTKDFDQDRNLAARFVDLVDLALETLEGTILDLDHVSGRKIDLDSRRFGFLLLFLASSSSSSFRRTVSPAAGPADTPR